MSTRGEDRELRAEMEDRSRRIVSLAIWRRMKAIVDFWEREERGKARVLAGALVGLAVLAGATALVALWRPAAWSQVLLIGFLVWVAAVLLLMRRHLSRVD